MPESKEQGSLLIKFCLCCIGGDHQEAAIPAKVVTAEPPKEGKVVKLEDIPIITKGGKMVKIYIIFYSTYGHTYKLAEKIKEGVDSVGGAEGVLYQVPETLPEEVLGKMHAPPKPDVPIITPADLPDADGFLFGTPTRFGMMASQVKSFFDATGQLWQSGKLVGKPAGIFVSVGTQSGGMETTALTAVTQLTHHGMIFVPVGYTFGEKMFGTDEVRGGSPYGAGTYAGATGARQPSEVELELAVHQGKYFAGVAKKLKS